MRRKGRGGGGGGGRGLISSLFFFFFDAWSSPFRETKKKPNEFQILGSRNWRNAFRGCYKIIFLRNYLVVCVVERRVSSPLLPKRILLCAGTLWKMEDTINLICNVLFFNWKDLNKCSRTVGRQKQAGYTELQKFTSSYFPHIPWTRAGCRTWSTSSRRSWGRRPWCRSPCADFDFFSKSSKLINKKGKCVCKQFNSFSFIGIKKLKHLKLLAMCTYVE